jgi:hypothetical protein
VADAAARILSSGTPVLAKAVAHNIVVVIHAIHELGLEMRQFAGHTPSLELVG